MDWTLDEYIRRNGARYPDKPGFIMDKTTRTWREVDRRVDQLAQALHRLGLQRNDRVATLMHNCLEYPEAYYGCARAGMIVVPFSYRLTVPELHEILTTAEPALMIVGASEAHKAFALRELLPSLQHIWVVGDDTQPVEQNYEAQLQGSPSTPAYSPNGQNDTFSIFFTSGTTGLPKGAMVSHLNLEANGFNQFVADGSRHEDVNLIGTPLYHMGAVFMSVTYTMLGCTQVVIEKFEPELWLEALEQNRATVALLIPTMINTVLNYPELSDHDLSSLRLIFYGGGPMPPAVLRRALAAMPCGFTQGYGLTETLEATFLVASDHEITDGDEKKLFRLASAGREATGADVRIIDDDGNSLGTGEVGEILIRSRSNISGYWRNPEETAATVKGTWFHTGDVGYLDEDRYLFVVDRKKDMVVSGGVNIYTKEIESVIYSHPAVLEAAVVGLPDDHWGEVVTACVVLRNGQSVTTEEITEYCSSRLAGYKKPRRVFFLGELPKNPSGKILKRDLREVLAVQ
jgi:long-chain acyl-CoA synthetase